MQKVNLLTTNWFPIRFRFYLENTDEKKIDRKKDLSLDEIENSKGANIFESHNVSDLINFYMFRKNQEKML